MESLPEGETQSRQYRRLVTLAVCLIFFALLGTIIQATFLAIQVPYTGLDFSWVRGAVGHVDANSPASQAGVLPDDIILTINDLPRLDAAADYAGLTDASKLSLLIERDGTSLNLDLDPVHPSGAELQKRLVTLAVAFVFAVFSFSLWARQPYDPTVILYLLVNQLGAAVLAFGILSALEIFWANWGFLISLGLLSPVLVHFHLRLVKQTHIYRWRKYLLILYGFALLLILWRQSYFILPLDPGGSTFAYSVILLYFALAIFLSVLTLIYDYTHSPFERRGRVRLVVVGTIAAFIPLVSLALVPQMLLGKIFVPYELTFPFLLFLPLAYAVAIRRHDLLQIERVVNRGVVHLILLVILMLCVLALVTGLSFLWPGLWLDQPLVWGGFTLLLVVVFSPLRGRMQALTDRLFYGGWYNYGAVVSEMSQGLSHVLTTDELADLLVNRLADLLRLKAVALFLHDDQNDLILIQKKDFGELPTRWLSHGSLGNRLGQSNRPILTASLRSILKNSALSPEEQQCLLVPGVRMWVPLVRYKKLQGVLLLGAKHAGEPFDVEDERLLTTLAYDATIAAENVRLVKALLQHTQEIKNLYSQLLQSREAERKRLARELHDQVIQDLINLHYYLTPHPARAMNDAENLQALRARVEAVINTLRAICTELRPAALDDLTLELAIQGFIEEMMAQDGTLSIRLDVSGDEESVEDKLSEDVKVCLFRVLQETIANVRRHARATQVQVELRFEPSHVSLMVQDNGQGFSCPASLGNFARMGHFGLAGSQERVHLLRGTFQVESAVQSGTRVMAQLPLTLTSAPLTAHAWLRDIIMNLEGVPAVQGHD
jgi:signal transduction histidine kinase